MKTVHFALLFPFIFTFSAVFAQSRERTVTRIEWGAMQTLEVPGSGQKSFLYFRDAQFDVQDNDLPSWFKKIRLEAGATGAAAEIVDAVYQPLSPAEESATTGKITWTSIEPRVLVGKSRKIPYALISFVPLRKNPVTGKPEKLISFRLKLTPSFSEKASAPLLRTYAASSVLATGEWYRIGVTETGIHKLSYSFLEQLGMDMSSIDPATIKVYGNGGEMLPFANSAARPDDLIQNAIYVEGEGDQVFGQSDYVLFYGEAPGSWYYSPMDQRFYHKTHLYTDTTYYFITAGGGLGKRIGQQASLAGGSPVTTFDDHAFHEADIVSLIKSGREWYGESFELSSSHSFTFDFPNIDVSAPGTARIELANRSSTAATYSVSCGSTSATIAASGFTLCPTCDFAQPVTSIFGFAVNGPEVSVTITKVSAAAAGWLNYIELNVRRALVMNGPQLRFRDKLSVGPGNISAYEIQDAASNVKVWDVTDPSNIKEMITVSGGQGISFSAAADSLREFIAFNGSLFYEPAAAGRVENQNLHALGPHEMIIIAHPLFMQQAERIAELHRQQDSFRVAVATPQQVYNEFSSGIQDVSAIRDFMKMFYDRAATPAEEPRYLLLFGDGSYDNKHRFRPNSNFIPTYQSANSFTPTTSYVSDDFYVQLDDNEGQWTPNDPDMPDLGVGRFPVRTVQEAEAVVNKILVYTNALVPAPVSACDNTGNTTSFGDWRNTIVFMADDEDAALHFDQAETMARELDTLYPVLNIDKIYLDAYVQQTTTAGPRYPEAREALSKRMEKGALLINYTGHGGELGLTGESVVDVSTISSWKNLHRLPLFVTATCEFSRFDDPERTSAGEYVLLNPEGGGVALLTTVRLVYAAPNFFLNKKFYDYVLEPLNDEMPRLGDVFRITKDSSGTAVNNRNFTLLGDPALRLNYPRHNVVTTKINNEVVNPSSPDTIKALSVVTVNGYVADENGVKLSSYNGTLYPTVYDKASMIPTLSNDGTSTSPLRVFSLQKNIIFKGRASVINGDFSFSFMVPKDIASSYGIGKISYYGLGASEDAAGAYENIIIGGYDSTAVNDITGPEIRLYMNDSSFAFGDQVNPDPLLYAVLLDSNGINTSGLGIGHDMVAVLDEHANDPIVLNDYFETDLNSHRRGSIRYPFNNLSEGTHSVSVKIWDIYNNSAQSYTEFVVATSAKLALQHVLNYPNPFTTKTKFMFEYKGACDMLDVQVQVFTVSGKLVKTLDAYMHTDGRYTEPIEWDGTDEFGDRIGKGVYIYRLRVRNSLGETAERYERLVILK